jgi:glutathione S-transferase
MYAPVATRFRTYDVKVDRVSEAYCEHILAWPDLREWWAAAQREPEQIEELDIEF